MKFNFDEKDFLTEEEREAVAAGPRAFAPEQMTACAACGRQSPPTRMNCLYCGERLPPAAGGEDLRRPALRPLEDWERGFNVVVPARGDELGGDLKGESLAEAAALVRIAPEELREFFAAQVPLPLARTAEAEEAALLERKLGALGLTVEIVSDEELAPEGQPPKRVRRLRFGREELTGRTAGGEEQSAGWDEIELIVAGRIYERRIETEKRQGRGAEAAESREFSDDESVIDLHFEGAHAGWRVGSEGFDFSCLGAGKGLLAAENFERLTAALRERAGSARFDDSYARLRHLLKFAWPPDEREVSGGLRRARPGKVFAGAVTVVNNESQFTRYGRLLRRAAAARGQSHT